MSSLVISHRTTTNTELQDFYFKIDHGCEGEGLHRASTQGWRLIAVTMLAEIKAQRLAHWMKIAR
jgi:hypothetical protein